MQKYRTRYRSRQGCVASSELRVGAQECEPGVVRVGCKNTEQGTQTVVAQNVGTWCHGGLPQKSRPLEALKCD